MPISRTIDEWQAIVDKNKRIQTEFLSKQRWDGLQRLFREKGQYVSTGKGKTQKLFIGIGLHELTLKEIKFGKTKSGYEKCDLFFYKNPVESWFNNSDLAYDTISCTHVLLGKDRKTFNDLWYTSFTANFIKEDFETLRKGTKYKCIVAHREEQWTNNGIPMRYKQGRNMGELIVRIKPEIVKVYDIDTPDSDIELNYFKLYITVK